MLAAYSLLALDKFKETQTSRGSAKRAGRGDPKIRGTGIGAVRTLLLMLAAYSLLALDKCKETPTPRGSAKQEGDPKIRGTGIGAVITLLLMLAASACSRWINVRKLLLLEDLSIVEVSDYERVHEP